MDGPAHDRDSPLFSVIIPLHNKGQTIQRAVHSVLEQTVQDLEVLVVDDGSVDEGPEIVRHIADGRVRLIRQPNRGVSVARNEGIRHSTGRLVAFLDGDDQWLSPHLKTLGALAGRFPQAGLMAAGYWYCRAGQRTPAHVAGVPSDDWEGLLPSYFASACDGDPPITASSCCIPRQILLETGGFPPGIRSGEDLDLWMRIAIKHPVAFSARRTVIYHLDFSAAASVCFPNEQEMLQRLEGHARDMPQDDVQRYLARVRLLVVHKCLLMGEPRLARQFLALCRGPYWRKYRRVLTVGSLLPARCLKAAIAAKRRWVKRRVQ